jgi:hypothetical protein
MFSYASFKLLTSPAHKGCTGNARVLSAVEKPSPKCTAREIHGAKFLVIDVMPIS